MLYPKDTVHNVEFRKLLLYRAEHDEDFQKRILEICKADILFWVNYFVWQFNPNLIHWDGLKRRRGSEVGPFVTWDFQDDCLKAIVDCIENPQDLVIEKSREMGASWMCILAIAHQFLFYRMRQTLLISRNAEAVDDRSPDSLLWKFDFVLRHLPGWMAPRVTRNQMFRGNDDNGATVTGQASTGKSGSGGRATLIFVDEFSLIREDQEVYSHTSDTSATRIFNFTHRGTSQFATALARDPKFASKRKLMMHWSQHPEKNQGLYCYDLQKKHVVVEDKNYEFPESYPFITDGTPAGGPYPGLRSPWYDNECLRKSSKEKIAMDLDINPSGSMEQFFDALLLRALIAESCREPEFVGDIDVDEENGHPIKFAKRRAGPLKMWCLLDEKSQAPKSRYYIGGDFAAGTGATPTCFSIFDGIRGEKVAQYTNPHLDPTRAAKVMVGLGWTFQDENGKPARLIWEAAGPGLQAGKVIAEELQYLAVYFRSDEAKMSKKITDKPGWVPTRENKRRLLDEYKEALRSRDYLNQDEASLQECEQFKYKGGWVVHDQEENSQSESGATVSHADHVIADALSWKSARLGGEKTLRKAKKPEEKMPLLSRKWREEYHRARAEGNDWLEESWSR